MALSTSTDDTQQPPEDHPATPYWVPIVVGVITFVVTAGVTYRQDLLTPLGSALAAGAAAVIAGSTTYLFFPSATRIPAVLIILLALACLGFVVLRMTDGAPRGVASFVGGCEPFTVHAQNRYNPAGASVRAAPMRSAEKVGSFGPNELVTVDGWVRTEVAYPTNRPPFNNDVWYHLADDSGWVSFAALRADPTTFDPSGLSEEGGRPVPLSENCSGTYRL